MGKRKQALSRPSQRMTKKERTRWQRERRIQRNLILVFIAVGVVSILVLAYGLYAELIREPNIVIAQVNGEQIHKRDYWNARRVALIDDWEQQYYNLQIRESMGITMTQDQQAEFYRTMRETLLSLSQVKREPIEEQTLQGMVQEIVLLQGARDLGIDPTEQEVDIWYLPEQEAETSPFETIPLTATEPVTQPQATPTPVSTLTPEERGQQVESLAAFRYDALVRDMENYAAGSLGFSKGEYLVIFRRGIRIGYVQQKVLERLKEDLPKEEEQVRAWHILLQERQARALSAERELGTGTSFAEMVVKYSDDDTTRTLAGDLGWARRGDGTLSPELEEAAFALTETNQLGPVVQDEAGYHVLQLAERDEVGDQVRVRHILIPLDRRGVAEEVLALVQEEGASFEQIALSRSEDRATAGQGGDMPWIKRGEQDVSPEVEAAAFALTTTSPLSPIVEDEEGYHILQLVERDDANEQVHVRQILIRSGASLAEDVLDQLQTGLIDFPEAVVEYSTDQATVDLAGDLGWVTQGDGTLSPELEEAVFALTQTNQLSSVVGDDAGWHLLQLVERDEAGGRVHLRIITAKKAAVLAEEIRAYLVEGDPETISSRFTEMATRYSDDAQSKANGGDLGWFGRGFPATTEIEEVAFSLEAGQVSEVFEGRSGWHIVWVREKDAAHPVDEELLNQRAQKAFSDWLDELLEKAVVERFPPPTATPTLPPPSIPVPTEPITATEPATQTAPITGTVTP